MSLLHWYYAAQPDEWLLCIRNGRLIQAGVGISLWRRPGDVVVRFTSTVQRVGFSVIALSRERLQVVLDGFILWSVSSEGDGPFRIRARRTVHHVPTSALLVEAGGRTFGYSADTAFDPALIDFLSPADLILHETNLGPAHTPYDSLAALPADLRARMRLIHYPDGFDTSGSAIAALEEGEVLTP